jgi:hypothetical protein
MLSGLISPVSKMKGNKGVFGRQVISLMKQVFAAVFGAIHRQENITHSKRLPLNPPNYFKED